MKFLHFVTILKHTLIFSLIIMVKKSNKSNSSDNKNKKTKSSTTTTTKSTNGSTNKENKKNVGIDDVYKKKTLHEHILTLPDTYIGSTKPDDLPTFIYDRDDDKIVEDTITYVGGLYKIFDEIIVNARDHTVRDKTCKNIKVDIDRKTGEISVWNDGKGIPVAMSSEYKVYLPELIFGNLLTSSNYDQKGKTVGGKNGLGSKACLLKGTPVPTFDGEMKNVEDIKIGDQVIGDDGNARNVLDIVTGTDKMYTIRQQGYYPYTVNENHILCLKMTDHGIVRRDYESNTVFVVWGELDKGKFKVYQNSMKINPNNYNNQFHIVMKKMEKFADSLPKPQVYEMSVAEFMKLDKHKQQLLSGYVGENVSWPKKKVDIDSYILGYWLANGSVCGNYMNFNVDNSSPVFKYFSEWCSKNNLKLSECRYQNSDCLYNYQFIHVDDDNDENNDNNENNENNENKESHIIKVLKKYNLINNKHVPKDFITNSREIRLKLLAGYADGIGKIGESIGPEVINEYGQSIKQHMINFFRPLSEDNIVKDIAFVARSCGLRALNNKIDDNVLKLVSVGIYGEHLTDIPTKIRENKAFATKGVDTGITGTISVEKADIGDYYGLVIDGNQRFVIGNFTVTHNCNIYSKRFEVHTIGPDRIDDVKNAKKIEYKQIFTDNMYKIGKPIINTDIKQSSGMFTKITFLPDYERFGMTGLTSDMAALMIKRCYDIAACTPSTVKMTVNNTEIKCRDFNDYVKLYYDKEEKVKIVHEKINSRWEISVAFDREKGDRTVSFVNGISTIHGGTHVKHVLNKIVEKVIKHIKSIPKHKSLKIQPSTVKSYLFVFINCVIEDPGFNSQSKEFMNSKMDDWCVHEEKCKDARCEISDEFVKKICDTGLMKEIVEFSEFTEQKELSKTDGKKNGNLHDITKLVDAKDAGTRNSSKCNLFVTEGDSAKAFVISGLSVIGGERYGVFPLKGKMLNVRNASIKQIKENKEFIFLKRILGLKQGVKYNDTSKLRYGGIIILTDQDPDGSHIKGLVINMLEFFWPELVQIEGFIKAYNTHIVKVWKKTDKKKKNVIGFYTITDYEKWMENKKPSEWNVKYYKGLGTSSDSEAKESFDSFHDNLISFEWEKIKNTKKAAKLLENQDNDDNKDNDDNEDDDDNKSDDSDDDSDEESKDDDKSTDSDDEHSREIKDLKKNRSRSGDKNQKDETDYEYTRSESHKAITKAFDGKKVSLRKQWLKNFNRNNLIEYKPGVNVSFSDFIDKDLIYFSSLDIDRSIPSMIDGLKPSQRMILFACMKKGRNAPESKVAQLGGYVSENTDYHHGEESLHKAIIGMAQNFTGSNNINLLKPSGNFGYRKLGGKEHASPRYIFTCLENVTNFIFRSEDDEILEYKYDGSKRVEPKYYLPIIPMALINGAAGIGTGFSTTILPHNPKDVIQNLKKLMNDKPPKEMMPWFNGFTGTIDKDDKDDCKYHIRGKYTVNQNVVHINELPIINGWIDPYKIKLMEKVSVSKDDKKKIDDVYVAPHNNLVDITVTFKMQELQNLYKKNEIEKFLKLKQTTSIKNIHLFDENEKLQKYESTLDIVEDFYLFRKKMYEVRKQYLIKKLKNDYDIAYYKVKFIKEYLAGTLKIAKKQVVEVIEQLETKKYPKLAHDHRVPDIEKSYRYLTDMSIISLTKDKIEELEKTMDVRKIELEKYQKRSVIEIWNQELDELLDAYEKWQKEWIKENETNNNKNIKVTGKKGKTTKTTKTKTK